MRIVSKGGVLFIGIILIVTSIVTALPLSKAPFSSMSHSMVPGVGSAKGEVELKYYQFENLDIALGLQGPGIWKTAIRLTQDEMAVYSDWTMTKINIPFYPYNCPSIDIRIYIYDKGNATHPGPIIANDTTFTLETTGIIAIPLVTSVNLSDYDELWIAIEWDQMDIPGPPGHYYAWMDTLTSPAIDGKGDWVYLNNIWVETQPWYDGNWGIGAIIEGLGLTEISIGNIKGPFGINADVSNIGGIEPAKNVTWSIAVTGGLFQRVTVLKTGTLSEIGVGSSVVIETDMFFGFGKISIEITAKANNAPEASESRTAFIIGPFVVGIR